MLKSGERYEDLEYKGLEIIQSEDGYRFTSDSVLVANLANVKRGDRVVDIGTGSGIIAILIAAKFSPSEVVGVEIQPRLADMAARSVAHNGLEGVVKIVNSPAQGAEKIIGGGFDVVVTNPPYDENVSDKPADEIQICKSEVCLTVADCVRTASRLIKYGGLFYMVNKARRMVDVVCSMRENGIEPKKLYLIQPKKDKDVDTFIVEGKKGAKPSVVLPKPIVIYDDDGNFTDFSRRLYNK
ncbi:MAG: tRNA1(Val) (adenine(37)-N6)-methyltransferase [Christensenellales bacterium]